jgi:metal-responsive CopG/Arc/MetJ family transcriptional regulator
MEAEKMKNVTISMDDELYRATRVAAARAGLSPSRYVANAAREMTDREGETQRNAQRDAFEAFLKGPLWDVTENGRMAGAEERNAR